MSIKYGTIPIIVLTSEGDTKFDTWNRQIKIYARQIEALKILLGTDAVPVSPPATMHGQDREDQLEKIEEWNNKSNTLYVFLCGTIDETIRTQLLTIEEGNVALSYAFILRTFSSSTKQLAREVLNMTQGEKSAAEFTSAKSLSCMKLQRALDSHEPRISLIEVLEGMALIQGLNPKYRLLQETLFLADNNLDLGTLRQQIIDQVDRIDRETTQVAMYNRKDDSRQSTTTNSTEPCCGVCVAAGRPNTRHLECNCFWKFPELRRNRRDNRRDTKSTQSNSNQKMRDIKQAEMDIQPAQAKLVALTSNNYNTSSSPADSDHNAWLVSRVSAVVKTKSFNSTDSIDFNLDTGRTDHCIMSQEAHKLTNVNVNHIEDFVLADDTKVQSKGAGYLSQLGNDLVHIQDFGDNLLAPKKLFDKGIATII